MNNLEFPSKHKNLEETKFIIPEDIINNLKNISNISEFQNNSDLFSKFQNYLKVLEDKVENKEISGLDLNVHIARIYKDAGFYSKVDLQEFVIDAYNQAIEQAFFENELKVLEILHQELKEINLDH